MRGGYNMSETTEIIEPQEMSVMSLNGEGTQENPYQITTVAEFRSMNDSEAYFKLMNDLDVNDSEWATGWTSVTLRFKEFDGDGYEIRNINDLTSNNTITFASSGVFKNVKILNIIKDRGTIFYSGHFVFDFVDTTISANFVESVSSYIFYSNSDTSAYTFNVRNSAITISGKLTSVSSGYDGNATMTNCMVNFDNAIISGNIIYTGWNNYINRVSLTGKANITTSGRYLFGYAPKGCYCAVDFTESTYKPKFANTDPANACFYDVDLMGETLTAQTNVHALTTEQCKDKDYLNSIGFVVV